MEDAGVAIAVVASEGVESMGVFGEGGLVVDAAVGG